MSHVPDPDLDPLFAQADVEDLSVLIDHLTDKGDGRFALSADACRMLVEGQASGALSDDCRNLISTELRSFGGNSIMNLMRGGAGVPYREILGDVADHLKVNYNKRSDVLSTESGVLLKVMEQALDKMTAEERDELLKELGGKLSGAGPTTMAVLQSAIRASGFAAYKLAAVVAQATSRTILGRGLAFGATAPLMRGISVFAGPIGWAITGAWTAFDLASPAYRITVPCVIQVAYIRQKSLNAGQTCCTECGGHIRQDDKFCSSCGQPLQPRD